MLDSLARRGGQARAGRLETAHGVIATPAFVAVATRAAIRGVTIEQARALGAAVLMGNTYHLYFQPGVEIIRRTGGLARFMNWSGPTMTDSGGFQVFSLGVGYGQMTSKVAARSANLEARPPSCSFGGLASKLPQVLIDNDGVDFRSPRDGSWHRFTPERSIELQHALGADIIFAFDECTSPLADYEYQRRALARTHNWAARSLAHHQELTRVTLGPRVTLGKPALFGIVQGGRFADLREQSARFISNLELARPDGSRGGFDGFGIGGSFNKEDVEKTVSLVAQILPEDKPRHLLGIGAVADIFAGVEAGCDTFDCVSPTRLARHGALETSRGRLNLLQSRYREDFAPPEAGCQCYTCANYTRAYLAHLFRAREMLGPTLASIHNLYFFVNLFKQIRQSILNGNFPKFRADFLASYQAH